MKRVPTILLLLLFSLFSFSQKQSDPLAMVRSADTVTLVSKMNGCFGAGINTYKLVRLKNKDREVLYSNNGVAASKKIPAKSFERFLKNYTASKKHFAQEGSQRCTTTTEFGLLYKKETISFTNTTCESKYNPEEFLLQLLR